VAQPRSWEKVCYDAWKRSAIHLLRKRGKSLRTIAAELGHSKTTLARALSEPVDQPSPHRAVAPGRLSLCRDH
jgi:lambda repressor-like predicted transcriptional regulator